jgi:hypothetical protein
MSHVSASELNDAEGAIPTFGAIPVDADGRIVVSDDEWNARADAAIRALNALRELPDQDPLDTLERMMRDLDDERRQAGTRTLFDGPS